MLHIGVAWHIAIWNILICIDIIAFLRNPQTMPKVYQ
jgi:hypothetical protein